MKTYRSWSSYLRERFGERVHKLCLDLGAGCPHRDGLSRGGCIFCDERGGGSGAALAGISLEEQIKSGAAVIRARYKAQALILYFQSYSATNLPLKELTEEVEKAIRLAERHARIVGLAFGTRPDLLPDDVLDYFDDLAGDGLDVWVEIGVQSLSEESLRWLRRGHDVHCIEDTVKRCHDRRFSLCAHLIAGIPGEDDLQMARSAATLASWGVRAFKFHPLYVLRGTALEEEYRAGRFAPLTLDKYAEIVTSAIANLPRGAIIQRLTADAKPPHLIAPLWVADKAGAVARIEQRLSALNKS